MITIELTAEQLREIRLLSRAPSIPGPAGTIAYVIKREQMELLREVLREQTESPKEVTR